MKYDILDIFGNIKYTADIPCAESTPSPIKLRFAVEQALENNVSLDRADLRQADLAGLDLSGKNLRGANLHHSDLSYSDLRYSNLRGTNLSLTNLSHADLRYSDHRYADLLYARNVILPVAFGPVGEKCRTGYATYTEDGVMVRLGCFKGSEDEAIRAVSDRYGPNSGYADIVKAACKVARERGILNPEEEK